MVVSALSQLFLDETDNINSQGTANVTDEQTQNKKMTDSVGTITEEHTEKKENINGCFGRETEKKIMENSNKKIFKMPLHYPTYTKEEYEGMPDWELDRLLAEYRLPSTGDLHYKRKTAIETFLWPDSNRKPKSSPCNSFEVSSTQSKKSRILEFLYQLLGFA